MTLRTRLDDFLAQRAAAGTLGFRGEEAAERHLKHLGYTIVAKRLRGRFGEIDLIAIEARKTIVFVEVKTRRGRRTGHPADVIDAAKQRRMTRSALVYLKRHGLSDYPARFDVVAIIWPKTARRPEIEHFKDVFEASLAGHELS